MIDISKTSEDVVVLDATNEQTNEYGHLHGSDCVSISKDQINALLDGKMLAFNDGEYSTFIVMES